MEDSMKTFRHALFAAALVMGIASAAQAADLVRKVDSFDLLADQSGSMMMKSDTFKMTKAAAAKQVLAAVNEAIPDLGYKASLHTVAPAGRVVAYGDWDRSAMAEGIAIGVPMRGKELLDMARRHNVRFVLAPEETILAARAAIAARGVYCEHTTAANYAAYLNYCRIYGPTPDTLITMCGAGIKSDH